MFFYVFCALLLLNAVTLEAADTCVDQMHPRKCLHHKRKGNCESDFLKEEIKIACPKTCGFCRSTFQRLHYGLAISMTFLQLP
ncbi:hypothetical protein Q1695_002663 [Nippostrongylus brasiliensis]|nr:hypothetical protein Q1695_002663 [Nippostrongylus brasiliensis]